MAATWEKRLNALEQLQALLATRRDLAGRQREMALLLAEESELAARAGDRSARLLTILDGRRTRETLGDKDLPPPILDALTSRDVPSGQGPRHWQGMAARAVVVIETTEKTTRDAGPNLGGRAGRAP